MLSSKLFTTALFVCLCICFLGLLVVVFCRVKLKLPYLFTYKAHSLIRRTLNFKRRLWQVSKMKISLKYPVIRRTQNYSKFCWPRSLYLQTIAKKSHMDNSIKVTLFNWLKLSFSGNSVWSMNTNWSVFTVINNTHLTDLSFIRCKTHLNLQAFI